jgi:predicted DNA-binding transcriptional regulator AlpA
MEKHSNQNQQLCTGAKGFGLMVNLSKRQIFRLNSTGKIPAPIKIGGSVRWKISDIEQWIIWGCPNRQDFNARMEAELC